MASLKGLWVTVEREPAKAGGLGEVSKTIPQEVNRQLPLEIQVVVPGVAPILKQGDWAPLEIRIQLPLPANVAQELNGIPFGVMAQYEEATRTWVYAITHPILFAPYPNLYFQKGSDAPAFQDAVFSTVMVFNRAAAAFIAQVQETPALLPDKTLKGFDVIMGHDWLTGPVLGMLNPEHTQGKVFMLHNTYDEARPLSAALHDLLCLSPDSFQTNTYERFSPLEYSIYKADVVIANKNYIHSIVQKDQLDFLVKNLWDKLATHALYDMHHGIAEDYDAFRGKALDGDSGFTCLKPSLWGVLEHPLRSLWQLLGNRDKASLLPRFSERGFRQYKAQNKEALQQLFHLNADPNALVYAWVGRYDPLQKGFYLVMDELEFLLQRFPQSQFIFVGNNSNQDVQVDSFIRMIHERADWKGRVHIQDRFVDRQTVIRIASGSDFFLMPSLYEPFGLAQLEAMSLCCVPIVHGVDGLRSTVSDPYIDALEPEVARREKVSEYGQVGVKIEPLNVPLYQAVIHKRLKQDPLNQQERWVLEDSRRKVRLALTRSVELWEDPKAYGQVVENALRFVKVEHAWSRMIQRYKDPLCHAAYLAKSKRAQVGSSLEPLQVLNQSFL
jgi:glycogen synthase